MLLGLKHFVDNTINTVLSFFRILLLSKFRLRLPNGNRQEKIVILGNGPSFKKDIEKYHKFLSDKDLVCVNHFPNTDYYTILKPKYFIIAAPELWLDNIDQKFIEQSNRLFKRFSEATTWDIFFFVPFESKKHLRWKNNFSSNKHIKLIYYNNIATEGYKWFRHLIFRLNLGIPRPHNIMIPALMLTIAMDYKSIYIWGADHSWLPEISVTDQNEVLLRQQHFYDEYDSKAEPMDNRGKGKRKLYEVLYKLMTAFKGYFIIREYASSRNVRITNTTRGSYIDAFDKIPMDEMTED